MQDAIKNITVLGSTGSVGRQALAVIAAQGLPVFALSAEQNADLLFEQVVQFSPRYAVIGERHYADLAARFAAAGVQTELLAGKAALLDIARAEAVSHVIGAIVGGAGLAPLFAAASAGKTILLANKEALVMAGALFIKTCEQHGAQLLPLDSEHNALFQSMPLAVAMRQTTLAQAGIKRLILTASGGPFLHTPLADLAKQTPEAACKHPNWSMGQKISVDSATMMNKGLEFIEAKWLFSAIPEQIEIVIHPESIVHSLVAYCDGSLLAQLGVSDMRIPIAHALAFPKRFASGASLLSLVGQSLHFHAVDFARYPCLALALAAANSASHSIVLNAANEIAVAAFLQKKIGFLAIAALIDKTLQALPESTITTIEEVFALDAQARQLATQLSKGF